MKQLELRSFNKGDEHEKTILVRPKSILWKDDLVMSLYSC